MQTELTDLKFINRIEIPQGGETTIHTWAVQLEQEHGLHWFINYRFLCFDLGDRMSFFRVE